MPTLTRLDFHPTAAGAPFGKVPIAADPEGGLYFYGETEGDKLLTRLDSTGAVVARFASRGEGPGELSGAGVLLSSGDTIAVYDTRKAAVVLFGPDGEARGEYKLRALGFPLALDGDRLFTIDQDAPLMHRPASIEEHRLATGVHDTFLGENDQDFVRAITPEPSTPPGRLSIPVFGVRGERSAIGNPRTGEIVVRDGEGEHALQLPGAAPMRGVRGLAEARAALEARLERAGPGGGSSRISAIRERLDSLDRERLPWFAWPGLQFDSRGRLWVFSDRSDSTMVDLFSGARRLGRLALPCYHPDKWISLAAGWLALQCKGDSEAEVPYELQLYRVTGQDGGTAFRNGSRATRTPELEV